MDFMQAVINDENIAIIEINYYHTGGCYVSLYDTLENRTAESYEFTKPASKSNRLSGEMGHLESNNSHIKINRSNLHARDTYEIVKTSTPVPSVEKNYFGPPYISKHEDDTKKWENILEVFEYELSQPQVSSVILSNKDKSSPTLTLIQKNPENMDLGNETVIHLDPKNYGEAIRFIIKNNGSLFEKYSLNCIPNMGKTLEDTPVVAYRNSTYSETPVSQKKPVHNGPVILDVIDCLKTQMDNNDVELFYIEKMEATGIETIKIELASGACVEFRANEGDLARLESYADKNKVQIEAEGFWTLGQTRHGGGSRRMLKIRAYPMFTIAEDGTKVIKNAKRFLLRGLERPSLFRTSLSAPRNAGEMGIGLEFSSNDLRFPYDVDLAPEIFAALCVIIEEKKVDLEKKYDAAVTVYGDHSIHIQKSRRVDYKSLIGYDTLTEEMFSFLSEAYRAGINIMVQGNTGCGKTTFIRALYEGANDEKVTALLDENNELLFPDTMDNFIAIRGSIENIANTTLKIAPARVVMDDFRLRYSKIAGFMEKCAKANIQMISSMHGSIERLAECKDGFVIPFEIEVELIRGKVKAINQVVVSGRKVEKNALWKFEDGEFLKLNIPSRTLRRKIEQNLEKATKEISEVKDVQKANAASSANPLVTISEQEKEELMEAMKTIQKFMGRF